jgi:hypothetical protein
MSREPRVTVNALEFDPALHCNLRCLGCSHSSPYAEPRLVSVESFVHDASILSRYMRCRQLRIVGGEPLLHPDLREMIRGARRSGLAPHIMLVTNGVLLGRQPEELWRELDSVKVTVYPATVRRLDVARLRRLAEAHGVRLTIVQRPIFRVAIAGSPTCDARLVRKIFNCCGMARACHTVSDGRLYRCSIAPFMDDYLRRLGHETDFAATEGIAVEERDDMADRIGRYLSSDTPLAACRFCLGSAGRDRRHRQVSAEEVARPPRGGGVEDLLSRTKLRAESRVARWGHAMEYLPRPLRRAATRLMGAEWLDGNADVFRPRRRRAQRNSGR